MATVRNHDRAPGWVARCPRCPYQEDLAALGWTRRHAFSWGKRHQVYCPQCERSRSMQILHLDEKGNPDQPLGLVLRKMLVLQAIIWSIALATGGLFTVVALGSIQLAKLILSAS